MRDSIRDKLALPLFGGNRVLSRREALGFTLKLSILASLKWLLPSNAWSQTLKSARAERTIATDSSAIRLLIEESRIQIDGRNGTSISINGSIPGPLIRLREGSKATIAVTNHLKETTSIHWHGVLVPPDMDGVPGVSFSGIKPGETFTYKFPVIQSGTYWYHSHSGGQELMGMYGPIVIDPVSPDPFSYDREHIIVLSDWTSLDPMTLIKKLKSNAGYFNYQKRDLRDFSADLKKTGLLSTLADRLTWDKMRMDPTDFSDVTGSTYSFLMNGLGPDGNWTGIFREGERIRLRFICAAAMTLFNVRIPGLKFTVVQADGQNIQPVLVEEFRIAPGETYDIIVKIVDDSPRAIFAETVDRSGYAMGTLSTILGVRAAVPERRKRVVRTMADMGMAMSAMKSSDSNMESMPKASGVQGMDDMPMPKEAPQVSSILKIKSSIPGSTPVPHGPDHHGPGNSVVPMETKSRLHEPGIGLGNDGRRVLVYTDLRGIIPSEDQRVPGRELELHLTGNMERYIWSIDGKKFSEAPMPILFKNGERLRMTLVNDTMMEHPMHLHGMWMYLENGSGEFLPRKHTVVVKPAERVSVLIAPDTNGSWAFHCHLLLHMEMGMFRVVQVSSEKVAG